MVMDAPFGRKIAYCYNKKDKLEDNMAKQTNSYTASGTAFIGCIITGVGLGLVFDNPGAGAVLGTGVGFLVMSIMRAR